MPLFNGSKLRKKAKKLLKKGDFHLPRAGRGSCASETMSLQSDISEAEALKELREKLDGEIPNQYDDQRLLKFLKARRYNVESAVDMMRKHLRYAQRAGLSHILEDYIPQKKSMYFATIPLGYDKDGCLVRLLSVGSSDLKGLAMCHTHIEAARYAAYILEKDKLEQKMRFQETGRVDNTGTWRNLATNYRETGDYLKTDLQPAVKTEGGDDVQVYILDLKGLQWSLLFCRPLAQIFVFLLRLYEANYPESLKRAYVVNVPSFFTIIYTFVKTILPSDILSKVDVISSDQCGPMLREAMDPSILPQALGGTRTDATGDPDCSALFPIPLGSVVPEEFYLESDLSKDPASKQTTVQNQSTFTLEVEVSEALTVLLWDFQTVDYDIGFCLNYRKGEEEEPKCLVPLKRVNCHRYKESGRYECQEPGIYELFFDNTYSWWVKKELIYKVTVAKPGEEIIESPLAVSS